MPKCEESATTRAFLELLALGLTDIEAGRIVDARAALAERRRAKARPSATN